MNTKLILVLASLSVLAGSALAEDTSGTVKTGPYKTCGKGKCAGDNYDLKGTNHFTASGNHQPGPRDPCGYRCPEGPGPTIPIVARKPGGPVY